MNRGRITAFAEITRPLNVVGAGLLVYIGAFLAETLASDFHIVAVAAIATGLATAAGNTFNDYIDRDLDRFMDSDRPIPRGDIRPKEALAYSILLFAGSAIGIMGLPQLALIIGGVNLLVLIIYSTLLEGLPGVGNVVVGYLVGSTLLIGAVPSQNVLSVGVVGVVVALTMVSREILKDIEDIEGDREEALHTLPIVYGETFARRVAGGMLSGAAIVGVTAYLVAGFDELYLVASLPAFLTMGLGARYAKTQPGRAQRLQKAGLAMLCVAFVVGRLA